MNTLSNRFFVLLSLFVAAAFLGSCKSDSTGPGTAAVTVPGIGSFFIMNDETLDSNGVVLSSDTQKITFVNTGTIYGKSDVVEAHNSSSADPTYFHYESNGDFAVYEEQAGRSAWDVYPFGSQGSVKFLDSSWAGHHLAVTAAGAGQGSVIVKGQSVSTEKVTVTTIDSDTTSGQVTTETSVATLQFAPSLGYAVEVNVPGTINTSNGAKGDSGYGILIDYKLQ